MCNEGSLPLYTSISERSHLLAVELLPFLPIERLFISRSISKSQVFISEIICFLRL